jgi:hypothetical protein
MQSLTPAMDSASEEETNILQIFGDNYSLEQIYLGTFG